MGAFANFRGRGGSGNVWEDLYMPGEWFWNQGDQYTNKSVSWDGRLYLDQGYVT